MFESYGRFIMKVRDDQRRRKVFKECEVFKDDLRGLKKVGGV